MEKNSYFFAAALFVVLISTGLVHAGITVMDWPMPYHDLRHTSYLNSSSKANVNDIVVLKIFNSSGDVSTVSTADINDDGKAEILFSTEDKRIFALDSEFRTIWSKDLECLPTPVSVFDIWNDSRLEILYGCSDGRINVLDSKGNLLWHYQTKGSIQATPIAVNLDHNKELEVIVPSEDKNLYVFDADGNVLRDYLLPNSGFTMATIGDVDKDGEYEIIVGSLNSQTFIISYSEGSVSLFDSQGRVSSPVFAKTRSVGYPTIAIGTGNGHIYNLHFTEYTKNSGKVKCNKTVCVPEQVKYSSVTADWDYKNGEGDVYSPAVADLDRDGELEYVAGSSDKTLYILNSWGTLLKKYSVNGKITSTPALADLDGNKMPEIVYGSSDGIIQILASNGTRIWEFHSDEIVTESPTISDLKRDNKQEILVPAGDKLFLLGVKEPLPTTTTTTTSIASTTILNSSTTSPATSTTLEETTSTTMPGQTTTTSMTSITTQAPINNSSELNNSGTPKTESSFFGLSLYTIVLLLIGLFFLLQIALLLVIYLLPAILQRKIEKIKSDILGYRKDLSSLEKINKEKKE